MIKKITSVILVYFMALGLFSSTVLAAHAPPSLWAQVDVNRAISENLVPSSLQSNYTQAITRAEFCALSVALYENITGKEIEGRETFEDTKDVNVEKAAAIGVVMGMGDNKFNPDSNLTREQAAVMLSRLADVIGKPFAKQTATFNDINQISSWAIEEVGQVQGAGIMEGIGNNIFAPQRPYTREQSIVTILRTYDVVSDNTNSIFDVSKAITTSQLLENYTMSTWEMQLYDQLAEGIENFEMRIVVDSVPQNNADWDKFNRVWAILYFTNPEFFWWNGVIGYPANGKPTEDGKYSLFPVYIVDGKVLHAEIYGDNNVIVYPAQTEIDMGIAWIESGKAAISAKLRDLPIRSDMTPYNLELVIHNWLGRIITFDGSDDTKHEFNTIHGALVEGRSDCTGFARTFQYIMNLVGVESVVIYGINSEGDHVWNAVKLDNQWYYVDLAFNTMISRVGDPPLHYIFNRRETFMTEHNYTKGTDHAPDINPNIISTETQYNYYLMTGAYISSDSEFISKVPARIAMARISGEWAVEFEFATTYADPSEIFEKLRLIDLKIWADIEFHYSSHGIVLGIFR